MHDTGLFLRLNIKHNTLLFIYFFRHLYGNDFYIFLHLYEIEFRQYMNVYAFMVIHSFLATHTILLVSIDKVVIASESE